MGSFRYVALDTRGQRVTGVLTAANERAALAELDSKEMTPVKLEAGKDTSGKRARVGQRRLAAAYLQLADLLRSGVPLLRSLRLLGRSKASKVLAVEFARIADAVEEGAELSEAMERRPEVFPTSHVAMVRAGEKTGSLEAVTRRLAEMLEAQADLKSKIVGNLAYPCVVLGFGVLMISMVLLFVVPRIRPVYAALEEAGELPASTSAVILISESARGYGWWILGAVVVAIFAARWLLRDAGVRTKVARVVIRVPLIGRLVRYVAVARFSRAMGTMMANSVPMLAGLSIARQAAGNVLMEEAIDEASEAVKRGESLAPQLESSGLFDPDVVEMIMVGEAANNLDEVLLGLARTLESRVDRVLGMIVRLIEPVLLLLVAVVVVVMALALLLPVLRLASQLG